jgi:hypothetical protein
VIRSDMQLAERASYFRRMIRQDFDLTGSRRFVLDPIGASRALGALPADHAATVSKAFLVAYELSVWNV